MTTTGTGRGHRLLDICQRLHQGEILEKRSLANNYGVSERTIQRDLEEMRQYLAEEASYMDVVYDAMAGGYRLERLDNKGLMASEVFAICKILLESRPFPRQTMQALLEKLLSLVGRDKRDLLRKLLAKEAHYYVEPCHGVDVMPLLWQLITAIREQRFIAFSYRRLDGHQRDRTVKPVAILFSEFYFYLIAYDAETAEDYPIVFRLDRMGDIQAQNKHFRIPYRDKFQEGEFRKRVQFMYPGKLRRITFTYGGPSLEAILDRLPTAKTIKEEAGVHTLTAESFGPGSEIWLRTQGENVKILKVEEI